MLIGMAKGYGCINDPTVRQGLAELYTLGEIGRYNAERSKAARAAGKDIPGIGNISKLGMSNIVRLQRDLGLQIVGAMGMLHAYEPAAQKALDEATGNPFLAAVTMTALYAQAPPIYGGTDQIQRNIIGERCPGPRPKDARSATPPPSGLPADPPRRRTRSEPGTEASVDLASVGAKDREGRGPDPARGRRSRVADGDDLDLELGAGGCLVLDGVADLGANEGHAQGRAGRHDLDALARSSMEPSR